MEMNVIIGFIALIVWAILAREVFKIKIMTGELIAQRKLLTVIAEKLGASDASIAEAVQDSDVKSLANKIVENIPDDSKIGKA